MLNHISIMGRLTRNPELKHTTSGVPVASFTIAVDRDFKSGNGEKETDFIDVVAWRNTAEFVSKYFAKGSAAIVAGRLQIRSYTDKDGNNRKAAEVVAENVYFAESKSSTSAQPAQAASVPAYSGSYNTDGFRPLQNGEDDVPF